MRRRVWAGALAAMTLLSTPVLAQDEAGKKAEARERFDRGLKLFNENDNSGALSEFKRAYELIPNQVVLYNIGLVYAAMGRSVEAVDALDTLLKAPGPITGDRLARARTTRDEHARRIAVLSVKTNVPAAIEVDNVQVGRTTGGPLELKLTGGSHIVGAIAVGHAPLRKEVTIAGEQRQDVGFDLAPIEGTVAHLMLRTKLPGADVFIDDQRIGQTPLAQSLSLTPGPHAVELRRPGYVTAHRDLLLGDGATADVALEPAEDRAAIEREGGALTLDLSESQVVVTIDGLPRGVYLAPIRLARGVHHVMLERGGFTTMERDVTIEPGRPLTVRARLDPTPETRAEVTSKAQRTRTIAWITMVAGAAIAVGGGVVIGANASAKSDAERDFDAKADAVEKQTGVCDTRNGGNPAQCNLDQANAKKKLDDANQVTTLGVVGLIAGGAILAGGVVLYFIGDDPHKYDRAPEIARSLRPWIGPTGGGLGFVSTF